MDLHWPGGRHLKQQGRSSSSSTATGWLAMESFVDTSEHVSYPCTSLGPHSMSAAVKGLSDTLKRGAGHGWDVTAHWLASWLAGWVCSAVCQRDEISTGHFSIIS